MSQETCWECGEDYASNEVFDIPVFGKGNVKWCFNCAMKQLQFSDYRLVKFTKMHQRFKIKSGQYRIKEYIHLLSELELCYGEQFGEIDDESWNKMQQIVEQIQRDDSNVMFGYLAED